MRSPTALVKKCRVCGDKALGFNFNGLCCESCKSFFRRNALRYEKYSCLKDGGCLIDCVTRKCCTKCRLDKCFSIGMNKDLIYSKLEKIALKKASTPPLAVEQLENDEIKEVHSIEESMIEQQQLLASKVENILDLNIRTNMSVCSSQFSDEPPMPNSEYKMSIPRGMVYSIHLNLYEVDRIKEVTDATRVATFYSENNFQVTGEVTNLMTALNCAELYIKKLVKLCKNIAAFKCLNVDDQLMILKSVFTEMLVVCFSYSCRPDQDGFPIIEDENRKSAVLIKINVLREANPQNVVYFCRENIRRFHAELENDSTIRDLLLAQQLFKPREKISCPEFMKYQYTGYNRLLHRYLEHKYKNVNKAQLKAQKLTEMMNEMSPVKDIIEGMFIDCDSSKLGLVLNEVFSTR